MLGSAEKGAARARRQLPAERGGLQRHRPRREDALAQRLPKACAIEMAVHLPARDAQGADRVRARGAEHVNPEFRRHRAQQRVAARRRARFVVRGRGHAERVLDVACAEHILDIGVDTIVGAVICRYIIDVLQREGTRGAHDAARATRRRSIPRRMGPASAPAAGALQEDAKGAAKRERPVRVEGPQIFPAADG